MILLSSSFRSSPRFRQPTSELSPSLFSFNEFKVFCDESACAAASSTLLHFSANTPPCWRRIARIRCPMLSILEAAHCAQALCTLLAFSQLVAMTQRTVYSRTIRWNQPLSVHSLGNSCWSGSAAGSNLGMGTRFKVSTNIVSACFVYACCINVMHFAWHMFVCIRMRTSYHSQQC